MIPLFFSLLITGLLGSFGHCVGMCGPLVIVMGRLLSTENSNHTLRHFLYHVSRIGVYAVMGGIAGFTGSLLGVGSKINIATGIISITLGMGIVFLGFINLGVFSPRWLGGKGAWITKAMGKAIQVGGMKGVMVLGALNGLLPCGLVYSALLVAAATANPIYGILAMLLFGFATIPVLILLGVGANSLKFHNQRVLFRMAAIFIILVGIQQFARGLSTLHLISPLLLGGVVIW